MIIYYRLHMIHTTYHTHTHTRHTCTYISTVPLPPPPCAMEAQKHSAVSTKWIESNNKYRVHDTAVFVSMSTLNADSFKE